MKRAIKKVGRSDRGVKGLRMEKRGDFTVDFRSTPGFLGIANPTGPYAFQTR
jgi:hypothetical protein